MNTEINHILQSIDNGFKTGSKKLIINDFEFILLPLGNSFLEEKKASSIIIYEDLFDLNRGFYYSLLSFYLNKEDQLDSSQIQVKDIDKKTFISFCKEHHYSKNTNAKIMLGLYSDEKLILVAGFSKPKKTYQNDIKIVVSELISFCFNASCPLTASLKKILRLFTQREKVDEIFTHINLDFFSSSYFEKIGFTLKENLPPSISWLDIESKQRFSTDQLIKNKKLSREELESLQSIPHGYARIRNTGNLKMVIQQSIFK